MKNILARGGVEFVAIFLGIALSLWVDEYQKSREAKILNNQILERLYYNLESDSIDGIWNYKAHEKVVLGGKKVFEWCEGGQKNIDSIEFFINSLYFKRFFTISLFYPRLFHIIIYPSSHKQKTPRISWRFMI